MLKDSCEVFCLLRLKLCPLGIALSLVVTRARAQLSSGTLFLLFGGPTQKSAATDKGSLFLPRPLGDLEVVES